jgi:hypothetical protein
MLHTKNAQSNNLHTLPHTCSNPNRTNDVSSGSFRDTDLLDTESYEYQEDNREKIDLSSNNLIYRYEFTDIFMECLFQFSKIHQYDNRQDFKEAWKTWSEENNEMIYAEITRLIKLGYRGDVLDKMFKSARYYFRKKCIKPKEPKTRNTYIGTNKILLENMDKHINQLKNKNLKPADSFLQFCEENKELLKQEIIYLISKGFTEKEEIRNKIKKTYKNRYFIINK